MENIGYVMIPYLLIQLGQILSFVLSLLAGIALAAVLFKYIIKPLMLWAYRK